MFERDASASLEVSVSSRREREGASAHGQRPVFPRGKLKLQLVQLHMVTCQVKACPMPGSGVAWEAPPVSLVVAQDFTFSRATVLQARLQRTSVFFSKKENA